MNTTNQLTDKDRLVLSAIIIEFRTRYEARYNESFNGAMMLDDLLELTREQREAVLHALQDLSKENREQPFRLADIGHDIRGLADHDEFFLPRIKTIAAVS